MTVVIAVVGTVFGVALLWLGAWIGRKLTQPPNSEALVGWREVWRFGPSPKYRKNPRAIYAFGAALAASFLMARANTPMLAPVIAVCIGIGFGATLNLYVRQ